MEPWTTAPRSALRSVLLLIYTAWIILGSGLLYAQGNCPAGWFGDNCRYQCHCQVYNTCAYNDGSCAVNDGCAPRYFGPGCQYYDISGLSSIYTTPHHLLDHNDSTCNTLPTERSAYLDWQVHYVIHWLRIVVANRSNLQDFQLLLEGQTCINERRYAVSDTSVDVVCDNTATIRWLELSGPAVGSLCSIYISIGRNIALKQQTRQSSNLPAAPDTGLSAHAVDGNTDNDYSSNSCTMTAQQRNASWEVIFNRPYILSHIRIHNNNDFYIGLVNFTITGYNGKYVLFMIRPNTPWNTEYYYNIDTAIPGTSVRILSLQQTALSLCEVEIFGEAVCPEATYGLNCEKHCTCSNNHSCSTVTGACSARCSRGTYGFKCSQYCSESCRGDCLERLGHCSSCGVGFRGALCTDVCSAGTYGPNCQSKCSKKCKDTCNHITGRCNCTPGHTGPDYKDCPAGRFGVNCQSNCSKYCLTTCDASTGRCSCTQGRTGLHCEKCLDGQVRDNCTQCPPNCADDMCNMDFRTCVSCTGNFTGPDCTDCLEGYFGEMCHKQCSIYCANRTCDVETQKCFSCVDGFRGDYCETVKENIMPPLWVYLMLMPCLTLIAVCLLVGGYSPLTTANANLQSQSPIWSSMEIKACGHGLYGANCELYCPLNCYNMDCNATTGACFRCNGHRSRVIFADCPRKKYGEQCESSCSRRCLNQECESKFGKCTSCIEGFTGDKCDKEAVCPEDTYGLNCEKHCKCSNNHSCSTVTGACSARCSRGTNGFKCSQYSSETRHGDCLERLWQCSGCKVLFRVPFFTDVCSAGTYGPNCQSKCSKNCKDTCKHITGRCNCTPRHTGPDCKDCQAGRFGVNCQSTCSRYCLTTCDVSTARCSCRQGLIRLYCEKCLDGQDGDNCTQTCPPNSADDMCNMDFDTCVSSTGNFTEPDCTECLDDQVQDNCTQTCPPNSADDMCNMDLGTFVSSTGNFTEPDSTECLDGQVQDNCTQTCPPNCADDMYNMDFGNCVSGTGNFTGPDYADFLAGYFGEMFPKQCSVDCANRTSDVETQKCFSCGDGFRGDYCKTVKENIMPPMWVYLMLIPCLALIAVCLLVGGGSTSSTEPEL